MKMRYVLLIGCLVFPSTAFSQALPTPNYSSAHPVPRAFAQALMNRGLTPAQVVGTMNGVATVAANENARAAAAAAAGGAAMGSRVASWLTIAARGAGWVGVGVTAVQIGVAGYQYYYGDNNTDRINGAQGYSNGTENVTTSGYAENTGVGGSYVFDSWVSAYFRCETGGADCAMGEAKVRAINNLDFHVQFNKDRQIVIQSYESTCSPDTGRVSCYITIHIKEVFDDGYSRSNTLYGDGSATAYYRDKDRPSLNLSPPCLSFGASHENRFCNGSPGAVQLPTHIPYPIRQMPNFLPNDAKEQLVRPEILAGLMNDLWRQASSLADYKGVTYPLNDPVTAPELAAAKVTVGQMSEPFSVPSLGNIPWAPNVNPWPQGNPNYPPGQAPPFVYQPETVTPTNPNPNPNPGNPSTPSNPNPEPDPGVSKTPDPTAPTINSILDPIFKLTDKISTFTRPTVTTECPTIRFTLWEKQIVTNTHCEAIEQVRGSIGAVFMFAYAAWALAIILSA